MGSQTQGSTHTHTQTCTHIHTYTQRNTHTHTYIHTHTYTHTHSYTHMHPHEYICIYKGMHIPIAVIKFFIHRHTQMRVHTHIHTHTHTHTHTCILMSTNAYTEVCTHLWLSSNLVCERQRESKVGKTSDCKQKFDTLTVTLTCSQKCFQF